MCAVAVAVAVATVTAAAVSNADCSAAGYHIISFISSNILMLLCAYV